MMRGVTKGGRGGKRRKKDIEGPAEEDERERGRREIEKERDTVMESRICECARNRK